MEWDGRAKRLHKKIKLPANILLTITSNLDDTIDEVNPENLIYKDDAGKDGLTIMFM
mgnify:CR=1 FL=1